MATAITTIGIMNIIQTKSPILALWWKAWLAILLLVFGLPSLVARFVLLPGDDVRPRLLAGEKVVELDLVRFYHSRRAASAWFPENALYNDLASATFELADRTKGETAQKLLQESAVWEVKALSASPADAYGWYRMAYLYYSADGPSTRAMQAWALSLAAAPYEPRLVFPRLQMAMGFGHAFLQQDSARIHVPHLIREAWEDHPDLLASLAMQGSFVSIVEEVLRNNPDELAAFREKTKP